MRVALVSPEYPPETAVGGIGTNTATLARALTDAGHQVRVVTHGRSGRSDDGGIEVVRVVESGLPTSPARRVATCRAIAAQVAGFSPDVVQAAEWEAKAWWLARSAGAPIVTRLATPTYMVRRLNGDAVSPGGRVLDWMERDQARNSSVVYASTCAIADEVSGRWDLERERIPVVPNSIDLRQVRAAGRGEPTVDLPARFLVFFGRVERRKGVRVLAEALRQVLPRHPDVHAVLIGADAGGLTGAEGMDLDNVLAPVRERVHMLGEMTRERALAVVARAELAVVPSLWESFGYVCIEAMALGVPVLASRAGGLPEIVEDGLSGWLVEPGDVDALATALEARLGDPEGLARAREGALARADQYDVGHVAGRVLEVFEEALARAGTRVDATVYGRGYRRAFFRPDDAGTPFHDLYAQKRATVLRPFDAAPPGMRVLDVGGGYGRISGPLSQRHEVTLCDISPEMIEEARERWPGLRCVRADARELPFEDEAFDAVVALDLLCHLPDLEAGWRELRRVVRPGGAVIADTTNALALWVLADLTYTGRRPGRVLDTMRAGGVLPEWRELVRHHRGSEARRAIAAAGLRLERADGFGPRVAPKWQLWWTRRASA